MFRSLKTIERNLGKHYDIIWVLGIETYNRHKTDQRSMADIDKIWFQGGREQGNSTLKNVPHSKVATPPCFWKILSAQVWIHLENLNPCHLQPEGRTSLKYRYF